MATDCDWVCPFCKGTGKISTDKQPPTKLDTAETVFEQGCTHCLGTGRVDLPAEENFDDYSKLFAD